jgi:hypothetical protein
VNEENSNNRNTGPYVHSQGPPTRAQVMREASNFLPINGLNLPEGYYRADMIDPATAIKGLRRPSTHGEIQELTGAASLQDALAAYQLHSSAGAQDVQRNQRQPRVEPKEARAHDEGRSDRARANGSALAGGQGSGDLGQNGGVEDRSGGQSSSEPPHAHTGGQQQGQQAEGQAKVEGAKVAWRWEDAAGPSSIGGGDADSAGASNGDISSDYRLPNLVLDHKYLQAAYVPLNYDEGYPIQPDGKPFWTRLPCEPADAYVGFQAYIEQGTTGRRQLFTLSRNPAVQQRLMQHRIETNKQIHSLERQGHRWHRNPNDKTTPHPRQLDGLSNGSNGGPNGGTNGYGSRLGLGPLDGSGFIPQFDADPDSNLHSEFAEWYYLYHWNYRAMAHDMFYVDSIQKSREMLALQLENTHSSDSARLYAKLLAYINPDPSDPNFQPYFLTDEGSPRFWERLTPRTAVDMLKIVTELQRVSIGMHPTQPNTAQLPGTNIKYLAGNAQRSTATSTGGDTKRAPLQIGGPTEGGPTPQLDPQDRARRLAILLDKAKARKEAG